MIEFPQIDPVLVSIGPLQIHWYGAMYLLGFLGGFWLARVRSKLPNSPVKPEQIEDLTLYVALGVVLGGRAGYVLFYNFPQFLEDPLWLFKVWDGGMSFHGGLLGVIAAVWLYARKINKPFVSLMDFSAPMVPIGLGLGRLGNFINQELWGRPTDSAWGMVFPRDPEGLPRHASQLYEFALEGVVLFVVLLWFSRSPRPPYTVSALFLVLYGCFRFAVEFVREPDIHLGFDLFNWMTRGQILCIPMIVVGLGLLIWAYKKPAMKRPG